MHTPALDAAAVATMRTITTAAEDLRAIREQWGDLLTAIDERPADTFPPRRTQDRVQDEARSTEPVIGRMPLILREHPAPANLDALDAAVSVERNLFGLADRIAEQVQRPVVPGNYRVDQDDRDDPARWHLPTVRDALMAHVAPGILAVTDPRTDKDRAAQAEHGHRKPSKRRGKPGSTVTVASHGSRAYGLHWAAVWIEGRILGEPAGDLFRPVPLRTLDEAAATVRRARITVEHALQRDGRTITLDTPCPWCGGTLTGRTVPGGEPFVTCDRGETCGAPVILDGRRRTWRGAELVGLWAAMEAARARAAA